MLFDIDGTLFDTPASMRAAARSALAAAGAEQAVLDLGAEIWFADEQARYEAYLAGELTFVEQRTKRVGDLFAELGLPDPGPGGAAGWLAHRLPRRSCRRRSRSRTWRPRWAGALAMCSAR